MATCRTERGISSHDRQVLQQGGLREGSQSLQRFDGFLVADGQGGTFGVEPGLQSRKINLIHHGDQHVVQVVRPGFKLHLKGGSMVPAKAGTAVNERVKAAMAGATG